MSTHRRALQMLRREFIDGRNGQQTQASLFTFFAVSSTGSIATAGLATIAVFYVIEALKP